MPSNQGLEMKFLKGWKTYIFNLLLMATAVIGFLEQSSGTIQQLISDPQVSLLVIFVIGLLGTILRTATNTSPFKGK